MSKMSDLSYDIEQLYIEGYSPKSIAVQLEIPIDMVYSWLESNGVAEAQQQ
jgi:hypothetical protein